MFANYETRQSTTLRSAGLTGELRKLLFDTPKEEWGSHSNY